MKKSLFACLVVFIFLSHVSNASAKGRLFHTNEPEGTIEELDPDTGAVIRSFSTPIPIGEGCSGLAFANNRLFFQNCGSLIYELNPFNGSVIKNLPNPVPDFGADALGFSGAELFVLEYNAGSAPGFQKFAAGTSYAATATNAVTVNTVSDVAATGAAIHVINPNTGALIRTLTPGIPLVGGLTYAGGRNTLFVNNSNAVTGDANYGTVYELDIKSGAVLNSFVAPVSDIFGLGYSFARGTLFVGDVGGDGATIFEVNPNTGAVINTLPVVPNWSLAADENVSTAVPTMNEWGMIFFFLLAGIASLYYLRRQPGKGI